MAITLGLSAFGVNSLSVPPRSKPATNGVQMAGRSPCWIRMTKTGDTFEVEGEITRCDRGGFYRVRLVNGHDVLARLSGKMFTRNIKVIPSDRVRIEMSAYDVDRGRIVYRYK
jgi:translation initiation factor IF-1